MSIREIAKELYRLEKEIERIKKIMQDLGPQEKEKYELQLKKIIAERDRIKAMLESMKQYPNIRRPR